MAPSTSGNEAVIARAQRVLLQNYKPQPIVLVRGEGCYAWDADGRRYLDFIGGIATCALGHCHPAVVAAARAQLERLWHVSNVFYSEPQVALAERLTAAAGLAGGARAFFCNSGAEANEALLKLARRFQHVVRGRPQRSDVVCFHQSFHGRTLATVTATGQPKYQAGFEPLPAGFVHVPFGDLEAVRRATGPTTAAVLVEPIQGEGGVRVAPPGFLRALRGHCDAEGLLLLVDEVQTGMGRTGKPFGYQHEGVVPDAFSLAKALGNGLPIGAMICSEAVAAALPSGTHGSTFGGNPVAATAAAAAWDLIQTPELQQAVLARAAELEAAARALAVRRADKVREVRGRGLLWGIECLEPAANVVSRCREHGLLVNVAGEQTVRLAPPLVLTAEQLAEGLALLERSL